MSINTIRNAVGASHFMTNREARRSFYFMFYKELGFSTKTIIADLDSMSDAELLEWFNCFK